MTVKREKRLSSLAERVEGDNKRYTVRGEDWSNWGQHKPSHWLPKRYLVWAFCLKRLVLEITVRTPVQKCKIKYKGRSDVLRDLKSKLHKGNLFIPLTILVTIRSILTNNWNMRPIWRLFLFCWEAEYYTLSSFLSPFFPPNTCSPWLQSYGMIDKAAQGKLNLFQKSTKFAVHLLERWSQSLNDLACRFIRSSQQQFQRTEIMQVYRYKAFVLQVLETLHMKEAFSK